MEYFNYFLAALLTLLQVGDWYTTSRAMKTGTVESNPVIAFLFSKIGYVPTMLLKVVGVGLASFWAASISIGWLVLLPLVIIYIITVKHNYDLVKG